MLLPPICKHIKTYMINATVCGRAQRGECRGHVARVKMGKWLSLYHITVNKIFALRPPSKKFRVRRTPTRLSGDSWNSGSSLAGVFTSPNLLVKSTSGRVQTLKSIPLFKYQNATIPAPNNIKCVKINKILDRFLIGKFQANVKVNKIKYSLLKYKRN